MRFIRAIGIGALSGVVAGVIWGLGARLAMRVIALMAERTAEFSLSGTVFILLIGIYPGMLLGLFYLLVRRWLPAPRMSRAACFGTLVLLLLAYPFYIGPLRNESVPELQTLAIILFAVLFVIFGVVVVLVHAMLDRFIPRPQQRWATPSSLGVLAIPACFVIAMVVGVVVETLRGS
jgi:hypothetical protein